MVIHEVIRCVVSAVAQVVRKAGAYYQLSDKRYVTNLHIVSLGQRLFVVASLSSNTGLT